MVAGTEQPEHRRKRRTVPSWVVVAIGAIATGAGLLWSSTIYDEHGEAVLDGPTATVLVALLGVVGTILGLLLQRSGEIRHQVKNSHGTNLRDDLDAIRAEARKAREIAEHAARSARKTSQDTVQLREDVQALRTDHTGTASDIRGIRRDLGRVLDAVLATKEKS